MIGRNQKKNDNVLNNIHQLKRRRKKEKGRRKKGRRKEANKLPKQPLIQPCSFPGRMTKENPFWGSHEKLKGVFKTYFNARNHSCRLTGQIK